MLCVSCWNFITCINNISKEGSKTIWTTNENQLLVRVWDARIFCFKDLTFTNIYVVFFNKLWYEWIYMAHATCLTYMCVQKGLNKQKTFDIWFHIITSYEFHDQISNCQNMLALKILSKTMIIKRNLVLCNHSICFYMWLNVICNHVLSFSQLLTIHFNLLFFLWLWCH
jgi:hypothetical protein